MTSEYDDTWYYGDDGEAVQDIEENSGELEDYELEEQEYWNENE